MYFDVGVMAENIITFDNLPSIICKLEQIWKKSSHSGIECSYRKSRRWNSSIYDSYYSDVVYDWEPLGDSLGDFLNNIHGCSNQFDDSELYYARELSYLKGLTTEHQFDDFAESFGLEENTPLCYTIPIIYPKSRGNVAVITYDFIDRPIDTCLTEFTQARQVLVNLGFTADQVKIGYCMS